MEPTQRTSRLALTLVLIGALLGSTLTAAFLVGRDSGTELTIAPGLDDPDPDVSADDSSSADDDAPERSASSGSASATAESGDEAPSVAARVECTPEGDEGPSPEDVAVMRAEAEGLAAVMTAAGVDHELHADDGHPWIEWDYDDAIAQAVSDSYYRDLYPPEPIPEADLAAMREENAALMAALDEAGIDYVLSTDPGGWEWVEYDWEDPEAQAIADEFYAERYAEEVPPEELARMREENAGLMAALDEAGIDYEVIVEPGGWEWVEFDWEDPDAQAVAEEYFAELYPPEPISAEDLARVRAENTALMAALDEAGIEYELVVERDGWEWVEYDWEDPDAQAVVDDFYAELYGDCWAAEPEWQPSQEELDEANATTDGMAAAFDAAGVEYTIESDEFGYTWLEWDYDDPDAQAVADAYWRAENDRRMAAIGARLDVLEAAFVDAGIEFERQGGNEWDTIIFDVTDPDALAVVAAVVAAG